MTSMGSAAEMVGLSVTHRRYVTYSSAHYAGSLVDGAYVLALFGDVATEMCIRTDSDEGLFASYADVQFLAAVRAGDVIEVEARLTRVGTRSRILELEARVVCRGRRAGSDTNANAGVAVTAGSGADVLDPPLLVVTATGTVVVPPST